jgi:Zn finger protein HypA/HybF involved in hydrogenase expression
MRIVNYLHGPAGQDVVIACRCGELLVAEERLTVSCPSCGKCADLAVLRRRYLEESKAG